jgi:starvation-inducible DNA-binding protein
MDTDHAKSRRMAPLGTPTNLASNAVQDISAALDILLADVVALYIKTMNFHWHMSGPRDCHLLLNAQLFKSSGSLPPLAASFTMICL